MYFNRILGRWIVDPLDYFLLSGFFGRLLYSRILFQKTMYGAIKRVNYPEIKSQIR